MLVDDDHVGVASISHGSIDVQGVVGEDDARAVVLVVPVAVLAGETGVDDASHAYFVSYLEVLDVLTHFSYDTCDLVPGKKSIR